MLLKVLFRKLLCAVMLVTIITPHTYTVQPDEEDHPVVISCPSWCRSLPCIVSFTAQGLLAASWITFVCLYHINKAEMKALDASNGNLWRMVTDCLNATGGIAI